MVVFTKGCPMRCLYCHNPDTWDMAGGTAVTSDEIINRFEANRSFYQTGGITVTGGEPLLQIDFVIDLFEKAKEKHIHTCLDTSGVTFSPDSSDKLKRIDRLLAATDLVMLDIKHIDAKEHEKLCGQPNDNILAFAHYLDKHGIPVWIRHVVVPGITFNDNRLYELGQFIGTLTNVKALDVLPYHDMGKVKYENMKVSYPLEGVPPLSKEDALKAKRIILSGIKNMRKKLQNKT